MDQTIKVERSVFSVNDIRQAERYDAWRDSIASIFDVTPSDQTDLSNFQSTVESTLLGSLMMAGCVSHQQNFERTEQTIARDGMDHYFLQFYLEGAMPYQIGGQDQVLKTGSAILLDLSRPFHSHPTSYHNLGIMIPRPLLDEQLNSTANLHGTVLDQRQPMVRVLRDHIVSLNEEATQLSATDAINLCPSTISLSASVVGKFLRTSETDLAGNTRNAAIFIQAKQVIARNLGNPAFKSEKLAHQIGISRTRLFKLFEHLGGVSSYIREQRMRRAMNRLLNRNDQSETILQVAQDSGYESEAAFSRAFKAHFGMPPRDARHNKTSGPSHTQGPDQTLDRRYENWMHTLSA